LEGANFHNLVICAVCHQNALESTGLAVGASQGILYRPLAVANSRVHAVRIVLSVMEQLESVQVARQAITPVLESA